MSLFSATNVMIMITLLSAIFLCMFALHPAWLKKALRKNELLKSVDQASHVALYRRRLVELERDYAEGVLDADSYAVEHAALSRYVLQVSDASISSATIDAYMPAHANTRLLSAGSMLMVLAIALSIYFIVFKRGEQWTYWNNVDQYAQSTLAYLHEETQQVNGATEDNALPMLQTMQTLAYNAPTDEVLWRNLARVYATIGATADADRILQRELARSPVSPQTQLFFVQYMLQKPVQDISPQTDVVLARMLKQYPHHEMVLMFQAMLASKRENYTEALHLLTSLKNKRLQEGAAQNNTAVVMLDKAIEDTQKRQAAYAKSFIDVYVDISPELKTRLKPSDVLFVVAKPAEGSPMPYAVKKLSAQTLLDASAPLLVQLSDQTQMIEGRSISAAKAARVQLVLQAKISATGNPIGQQGDFESTTVLLQDERRYDLLVNHIR